MEQPKTLKVVLGATCLALAIIFASGGAIAQTNKPVQTTKTKTAAKKTTAAPEIMVRIDTAAINVAKPDVLLGSTQIADIVLKFIVAGIQPESDVTETLAIDDRTSTVSPQFFENSTASDSMTINIPKTSFMGIGSIDTVKILARISYKKVTNAQGFAYINIAGQPRIFTPISFLAATRFNRPIELLDSTTKVQLDTFQKGKKIEPSVKLYFKLRKATGTDTTVRIIPDDDIKNLILSDDPTIKPTYAVAFASTDWNSKKDTVVNKTISVFIKPLVPIEKVTDLMLRIDGKGATGHVVELLPSKTALKNLLTNPVDFDSVEIVKQKIGIPHYVGSAVNTIDCIPIQIKLKGKYNPLANQIDFTIFDTDSVASKHFQVINTPITLTQESYDTAKNGILRLSICIRTVNLNDSTSQIHYIDLQLKYRQKSGGGPQPIKITAKDHAFWAEVGTNFSLLDDIKTTNLYAGVFGYLKDVTGVNADRNNLSFTGGVYETQSVTLGSSSASGFNYRDGSSTVPDTSFHTTPYQYYKDTGKIQSTTTIKSIGLFFSPQIRLTNTPTEESGIHLYLSLYAEMLWQRVTSTLNYAQTAKTNTYQTGNLDSLLTKVPFKESEFDLDYRSHYIGFGLPIYIKEDGYSMYINGVYGITSQRFVLVDNSSPLNTNQYSPTVQNINSAYTSNTDGMSLIDFAQPKSRWNSFYLIQYRLTEIKYGITFSGEVRGLTLNGSKPTITLALSKKFDLSALLKPLVAPF